MNWGLRSIDVAIFCPHWNSQPYPMQPCTDTCSKWNTIFFSHRNTIYISWSWLKLFIFTPEKIILLKVVENPILIAFSRRQTLFRYALLWITCVSNSISVLIPIRANTSLRNYMTDTNPPLGKVVIVLFGTTLFSYQVDELPTVVKNFPYTKRTLPLWCLNRWVLTECAVQSCKRR